MRSLFHKTREVPKCGAWTAAIGCLVGAIVAASTAVGAQTDAIVRVGRLPPAHARAADGGAISPDGQWFAYRVVMGHTTQIWLLNLASGATRLLTPRPAYNREGVSWAPDSRHLSFVEFSHRFDSTYVHVVRVDGDSDRIAHAFGQFAFFGVERSDWTPAGDTILLRVDAATVSYGPSEELPDYYWLVPTHGGMPREALDTVGRARVIKCCGLAFPGYWVNTVGEPRRCVAGPLADGEPANHAVATDTAAYFATGHRLYAADVRDGAAHLVAGVPSTITSLSMSRDGRLAITARAPHDSVAELWLLRPPLAVTVDTLPRCPEPPAPIMAFVAQHQRWKFVKVMAELPAYHLQLFQVDIGSIGDIDGYRYGLRQADRIGWMDRAGLVGWLGAHELSHRDTMPAPFPVATGDHVFYTAAFDTAMARIQPQLAQEWRGFLATEPTASIDDLLALAKAEPEVAGLVARNPALRPASASREQLLAIGMLGPDMARAVLGDPRLAADPAAIVAIAHSPRAWANDSIQTLAAAALLARAPSIVQDPRTEEPVLFAIASWNAPLSPALAALMLEHPAVQRSPRVLAAIAARTQGTDVAVRARERLAALGTTAERELTAIVYAAAQDHMPATALYAVTFGSYGFFMKGAQAPIEQALAELTDSTYANLRGSARNANYSIRR